MALSLRRNRPGGSVGLDLDGGFVAAVQLTGGRLAQAASAELPDGLVSEGEVADAEVLAEELQRLFKAAGLPRVVRLGVANQQIVVRQLELPRIEDPDERAAAVRFQAAEAIAMPLEEAILDFQEVGEVVGPEGSVRVRLVVVAARAAMIEKLVAAVRGAGLKPEGIDLSAFALVRALGRAPGTDDAAARVFCHLGAVTNLAVAVGESCLFTRPLSVAAPSGGEGEGTAAAALAEEIRLSIDFYMGQPDARWVGDVVLSGPGAAAPGLAEELGAVVGLPVSVADPLGGLDATSLPIGEDPHRHTVAAGLALGAAA